jgi:pyrroloquinoline-quinone synthase
MDTYESEAWTRDEFESRLRALGKRYHIYHPFHIMMNEGQLSPEQLRGWVANRFYYQVSIPLKDAALLANCPERTVRQAWIQRILDHDGREADEGGIEAWLRLGEACGLERDEMYAQARVLPGVRFAVDAYVNFVRNARWEEGICSSLTELFAPTIHRQRLATWPKHYPWIDPDGLQYFRNRLSEARRDVDYGLDFTLKQFRTRQQQERALQILQFKLDVLWSLLDALYLAYVLEMPPYYNVT